MNIPLSWSIIKRFALKNTYGISFQDVDGEFPGMNPIYLRKILVDMVKKGMLRRISRDNYYILPLNADPLSYTPDGKQVAKYLMMNMEYYIGYASALRIHGLIRSTQPQGLEAGEYVAEEYVATTVRKNYTSAEHRGITIHLVKHNALNFFGYDSFCINSYEEAMVSDLEKTIVDIASKPQLCGGIVEVGNAIYQAKDRTEHDKIFLYFRRNMNISAKKRYLFLTDLLGLDWTPDHEWLLKKLGPAVSLLDPLSVNQGRIQGKFGLKINVDPDHIKKSILQH